MGQFVWIDTPTPSGSVPPTFTAWGGLIVPTIAPVPESDPPPVPVPAPAPVVPPLKVTCELLDLNRPAPTPANPNSQRVQLVDPCAFFCDGKQWRANFGGAANPIPVGNNYRVKARLFINGAERDTDTLDPFTVSENALAINPACAIANPNPGGDGGGIPIPFPPPPPPPTPAPIPPGLEAAAGGLPSLEREMAALRTAAFTAAFQAGRSFPISFDFLWDPRIVACVGLVFRRGTSTVVSLTGGQITIGRCAVAVPIPNELDRFTARVLLLDAQGQVVLATPDVGLPR